MAIPNGTDAASSGQRLRTAGVLLAVLHLAATAYGLEPDPLIVQYAYTRTSWTERDGLPANQVVAIAQDRDGYLWLGTPSGLARFDGLRFVPWEITGRSALGDTEVTALCADRDGRLWVGFSGSGGISRLSNKQVVHYGLNDGLSSGRVAVLLQDRQGSIWAGTQTGLSRFRNNRWEQLGIHHGLPAQTVLSLYEDHAGVLWVGTSSGVFFWRAETDRFERPPSPFKRVLAFSDDGAGTIWVTDVRRAFRRLDDARAPDPSRILSGSANGSRLIHDQRGNLWVGTVGNGLLRLSGENIPSDRQLERFTRQDGLAGDLVWALKEDREGNIWVGTQGGLSRLSPSSVFSIVSSDGRMNVVRGLTLAPDGTVWAGTANGLIRFASGSPRWYSQREGLPSTDVTAVHADRNGNVWVATSQSLARYGQGRFVSMPLVKDAGLNWIVSLTTDHRGTLWLRDLDNGLFQWKDGKATPFNRIPESRRRLVSSAYPDSKGRMWIGFADGGLAVYQDDKVQFHSPGDGLASGRVDTIYEDKQGIVWIGTPTGLTRFKNGRFLTLRQRNNLPGTTLTAIVEGDEGYLWLGVSSGIVRLNPDEFDKAIADSAYRVQYTLFDTSDGLSGALRLTYPTASRGKDGTLWFVTSNGLSVVDPSRISENRLPPTVRIEGVAADDRSFSPVSHLSLPPRISRLQIDYTALSLTASTKIRFRYLLEGFDTGWVNAGASRRALYTNLPPGDYRFHVAASNRDGTWSGSDAIWDFSLQPAFYQTGWFHSACGITAALILWAAWRLRLLELRHQFASVLAERARVAREIHDTLLQSLVGLALQFDTMASQLDSSPETVKQQLGRVRRQVEHFIREARQSIWDLRSPTLEMLDLPAALREAGEGIAAIRDVRFEFLVNGKPRRCTPKIEEQLLRIGQEAITNAVRHSEARVVRLELTYSDDAVHLRVSDDGRGFDPEDTGEMTGNHWGLLNMQERAQQIGAHLRLVSRPGGGTRVETSAPLSVNVEA